MSSPICDSLFLSPVTANEIELEIAKLNSSYKAVGPSSIPIVIVKILKVAYYSFIRVQEVYTINVQI